MKILFFAQSREIAGCASEVIVTHAPVTQDELWLALNRLFPGLAVLQKSARLARNEIYLQPGELLQPEDEIAIIPPVSGG